jgi:hypothetical protein
MAPCGQLFGNGATDKTGAAEKQNSVRVHMVERSG